MLQVRKSNERGYAHHGWLETYHTFSFGNYYDPRFRGFSHLLVINEDRVQPADGFDEHPHRDMEIITYILDGELEHRDSMGTGSVIRRGDVQRMSAGTGVTHSEMNPSRTQAVHLLQIWIAPEKKGIKPEYEQKHFSDAEKKNQLRLLVSPSGERNSLRIHQDAKIYASLLDPTQELRYELPPGRHAWLQVARGSLELNGKLLNTGDGAAISEEATLRILAREQAEFLLFDLA